MLKSIVNAQRSSKKHVLHHQALLLTKFLNLELVPRIAATILEVKLIKVWEGWNFFIEEFDNGMNISQSSSIP